MSDVLSGTADFDGNESENLDLWRGAMHEIEDIYANQPLSFLEWAIKNEMGISSAVEKIDTASR